MTDKTQRGHRLAPAKVFTMTAKVLAAKVGNTTVVDLAPGNPLSAQFLEFARRVRRGEA